MKQVMQSENYYSSVVLDTMLAGLPYSCFHMYDIKILFLVLLRTKCFGCYIMTNVCPYITNVLYCYTIMVLDSLTMILIVRQAITALV